MESYASEKLNGILSKFFTNFDPTKLSLSYWNASLTLSDLHLKTDVLDQFNLPFRVVGGKVGSLLIDIGKIGLGKLLVGSVSVVMVTLNDVYILAVPPSAVPYNKQKEEEAELERKRHELDALVSKQTAKAAASAAGGGTENDTGYFDNAILRVINNVKVQIKNIHIRYEDDQLKAGTPFSFGFVLSSLDAQTVNSKYKPSVIDLDETFYKLVELKSTGFYWNDHEKNLISARKDLTLDDLVKQLKDLTSESWEKEKQGVNPLNFLLGPLETELRAMVTLNPEKLKQPFSKPKAELQVKMPELTIELSNGQFGEALLLAESLEQMQRSVPYRKFRPENTPYKGHAKEWWKFANNCELENLRKTKGRQKSSWAFIQHHPDMIKRLERYTKLYTKIVKGNANEADKMEAQKLEDQMDNIGIMNVRLPIDMIQARETKMKMEKKGFFFGYTLTAADHKRILSEAMTQDEKQKYTLAMEELAKPPVYPEAQSGIDYTEFKVNVDLPMTVFNILNVSKNGTENVLQVNIDGVGLVAETHPVKKGFKIDAIVEAICVTGLKKEDTTPQLLKSTANSEAPLPFLVLSYEKHPFDSKAGSRVKLASQKCKVIYHAKTVQRLVDTFTWPEQVELRETTAVISSKLDSFTQSSLANMQDRIRDTSEMEIDLQVEAPMFILPENGEISNTSAVLIVNLGTFLLKSIPREVSNDFDISKIEEVGKTEEEIDPNILKIIYNQYLLKLADFEILLVADCKSFEGIAEDSCSLPPILKKGQINAALHQCVITDVTRFPKFRIGIEIPTLNVDLAEDSMLRLLKMGLTYPLPKKVLSKVKAPLVEEDPRRKGVQTDSAAELEMFDKLLNQSLEVSSAGASKIDTDVEHAVQLTNLFCTLHVEGLKCLVSKLNENQKLVPVLDIAINNLNTEFISRSFGNTLNATLSDITITYLEAKIIGFDGPIHLLDTPSGVESIGTENSYTNPVVTLHIFVKRGDCPKGKFDNVNKFLRAKVTRLDLILHQDGLISILSLAETMKIQLEQIQADTVKSPPLAFTNSADEGETEVAPIVRTSLGASNIAATSKKSTNEISLKLSAELAEFNIQLASEIKRFTQVNVKNFVGDYEDGANKSTILVILDAVELINMDTATKYSKIFSVSGKDEKLVDLSLVIFKESPAIVLGELDPSMDMKFTLGSPRLILIGSFFGNIMNFANNFQFAKEAIVNASRKAVQVVKEVYQEKQHETKIKMDFKIGAPQIFMPRTSTSAEAVAIVLGELLVNNQLKKHQLQQTGVNSNGNAVLDDIAVSLIGIKMSRVILDADVKVKAESIVLDPVSAKLNLVRNLSPDWFAQIPQFKIGIEFEETVIRICADDILFAADCVLDVLKSIGDAVAEPQKTKMIAVGGVQWKLGSQRPEDSAEHSVKIWTLSFRGTVKQVGLVVYSCQKSLEAQLGAVERVPKTAIGELVIQNISMSSDIWSNKNLTGQIVLNDIFFQDSRKSSGGITDFIKRKSVSISGQATPKKTSMICLEFEQIVQENGDKVYLANIQNESIDTMLNMNFIDTVMKVVVNPVQTAFPKILEKVEDYIKAIQSGDKPNNEKKVGVVAASGKLGKFKPAVSVNGKVRLNEINLYLFEDVTASDTNALVLSVSASLDMKSDKGESHGSGEFKFGLGTTNFGTKVNRKLTHIIRPAVFQIKLDMTPQWKYDIDLIMPDIFLRFSAGTLLLITKIANSLKKSFSLEEVQVKPIVPKDYTTIWNPRHSMDENYWFLNPASNADTGIIKPSGVFMQDPAADISVDSKRVIHERVNLIVKKGALSMEMGAGAVTIPVILVDWNICAEVTNWSSDLLASGNLKVTAAYNNPSVGAWEYLLEPTEIPAPAFFGDSTYKPWEIKLRVSKPETTIIVNLYSEETMELTLSRTGLVVLKKIVESFVESAKGAVSEDDIKLTPFTFKNDLGSPLTLKYDATSPFPCLEGDDEILQDVTVSPGESVDIGLTPCSLLKDADPKKAQMDRNLTISIPDLQFDEIVNVGEIQCRFFALNKKSTKGEGYGIVIAVATDDFCVTITARGILKLVSEVDVSIEVCLDKGAVLYTIPPLGTFNIPLADIYENTDGLFLKPEGYELSPTPLKWARLRDCTVEHPKLKWWCQSKKTSGNDDVASLKVIGERVLIMQGNSDVPTAIAQNYMMTIRGQVVLNNLLPLPMVMVLDSGTEFKVEPGRAFKTFCLSPETKKNDYSFTLKLPEFRGQSWSGKVHLQQNDQILSPVVLTSRDKKQSICFGYMTDGVDIPAPRRLNEPITIYVYCPYWMVNYTGLNLSYKSADGINVITHPVGQSGPVLFANEKELGKSAIIKCEESGWSQELAFDHNTGVPLVISLKGSKREFEVHLSCVLSSCTLTRIVTITPKYTVVNTTPNILILKELDKPSDILKIPPNQCVPFWPKGKGVMSFSVEGTSQFTPEVSFAGNAEGLLKLENKYGGIRISISNTPRKTTITLSEFNPLDVTVLIVNDTKMQAIRFFQVDYAKEEKRVDGGHTHLYPWENANSPKTLEWTVTECTTVGNGDPSIQIEFSFNKNLTGQWSRIGDGKIFFWIAFTRNLQPVLFLTENKELIDNILTLKTENENKKPNLSLELGLSGLGISLVDNLSGIDILYCRISSMPATWEYSLSREELYKLLPPNENAAIESSFQKFQNGQLPDQPAVIFKNVNVNFNSMMIDRSGGKSQHLLRHAPRRGVLLNLKLCPLSMSVELKLNSIQVDNQIEGAHDPISLHISPLKRTLETESEVHPYMVFFGLDRKTSANCNIDFISATLIIQDFELCGDIKLFMAAKDCLSSDSDTVTKSKNQLERYETDYSSVSEKEIDFYAKQSAKSMTIKRITIFEKIELYTIKLTLTFSLKDESHLTLGSIFLGLGAVVGDITDASISFDGLGMNHARLTMEEFKDEVFQHYKSIVICTIMKLAFGLDILGNPVKFLSGIQGGLFTMLGDPIKGVLGGHPIDGLMYGAKGLGQVVGSATDAAAGIVGGVGKLVDVIGLGSVLGSRGLLGGITTALHMPGKAFDGKIVEYLQKVRPSRNMQLNTVLKPNSVVIATGRAYLVQFGSASNDYLFHCATDDSRIFLVTINSAFYLSLKDGKPSKIWDAGFDTIDTVAVEKNTIVFKLKPISRGYTGLFGKSAHTVDPVIFNNTELLQSVFLKVQEAIKKFYSPNNE